MIKRTFSTDYVGMSFLSLIHAAGCCLFNQAAVMGHRIVETEAAGKVIAFKAISAENAAGDVAAQTALTDDVDRLTLVQLTQPLLGYDKRKSTGAIKMSQKRI